MSVTPSQPRIEKTAVSGPEHLTFSSYSSLLLYGYMQGITRNPEAWLAQLCFRDSLTGTFERISLSLAKRSFREHLGLASSFQVAPSPASRTCRGVKWTVHAHNKVDSLLKGVSPWWLRNREREALNGSPVSEEARDRIAT